MSTWGKVAIGARISKIHPMFFFSWTRLVMRGMREGDKILNPPVGMPHSCAANHLVIQFLKSDCDSLLFIDDDMCFDHTTLGRLRSGGASYGVFSALYPCRQYPHKPLVLRLREGETNKFRVVDDKLEGVVECDTVGLGFTLIKRKVISDIVLLRGDQNIFCWDNYLGEDGLFCRDAKTCGHKIAVDTDVVVGHQVEYTATWNTAANQSVLDAQSFV